jgi:hypothetical protein
MIGARSPRAAQLAATPARETGGGELKQMYLKGIPPMPTSPPMPEAFGKELDDRVYILPVNTCGWFKEASCENHLASIPCARAETRISFF